MPHVLSAYWFSTVFVVHAFVWLSSVSASIWHIELCKSEKLFKNDLHCCKLISFRFELLREPWHKPEVPLKENHLCNWLIVLLQRLSSLCVLLDSQISWDKLDSLFRLPQKGVPVPAVAKQAKMHDRFVPLENAFFFFKKFSRFSMHNNTFLHWDEKSMRPQNFFSPSCAQPD